jgi:hypothetical protein
LYGELFFALAAWVDAPAWSIATTNSARVTTAAPAAQNRLLRVMGVMGGPFPFLLIPLSTPHRHWGTLADHTRGSTKIYAANYNCVVSVCFIH